MTALRGHCARTRLWQSTAAARGCLPLAVPDFPERAQPPALHGHSKGPRKGWWVVGLKIQVSTPLQGPRAPQERLPLCPGRKAYGAMQALRVNQGIDSRGGGLGSG